MKWEKHKEGVWRMHAGRFTGEVSGCKAAGWPWHWAVWADVGGKRRVYARSETAAKTRRWAMTICAAVLAAIGAK